MLRQCWHEQGTNPAVPVPLEGASSSILGDPATSVFVVGAGFARKRPESPPNGLGAFGRANRPNPEAPPTAKAAGLHGSFSGHSGRVGMARDLVSAGTSVPAVQVAGPMGFSGYARAELAARGAVASYYRGLSRLDDAPAAPSTADHRDSPPASRPPPVSSCARSPAPTFAAGLEP